MKHFRGVKKHNQQDLGGASKDFLFSAPNYLGENDTNVDVLTYFLRWLGEENHQLTKPPFPNLKRSLEQGKKGPWLFPVYRGIIKTPKRSRCITWWFNFYKKANLPKLMPTPRGVAFFRQRRSGVATKWSDVWIRTTTRVTAGRN